MTGGAARAWAAGGAPRAAVWPFARILVPLDGSELAAKVVETVEGLVAPGATTVTLLRVAPPRSAHDHDPAAAAELELERQAEEIRERLGPAVRLEVQLARGAPADEIVRHARATGQELIAMATHGRSGVDRLLRGSVAEEVLRTTEAPLLLVNPRSPGPPRGGFARIVVPLDGSARAEAVLPSVERIAAASDARVSLLVVDPPALGEQLFPFDPDAHALRLRPVVARLEEKGLRADAEATSGVVADEVLRASAEADLLAMTTHGRTGLTRLWSGSVAERVLREARCPLLVVRAP